MRLIRGESGPLKPITDPTGQDSAQITESPYKNTRAMEEIKQPSKLPEHTHTHTDLISIHTTRVYLLQFSVSAGNTSRSDTHTLLGLCPDSRAIFLMRFPCFWIFLADWVLLFFCSEFIKTETLWISGVFQRLEDWSVTYTHTVELKKHLSICRSPRFFIRTESQTRTTRSGQIHRRNIQSFSRCFHAL